MDQAWRNFRYTFKPGDTREIHSKRQFQQACRETGQVPVSREDLVRNGVPYTAPAPTVDAATAQTVTQQVLKEMTPDKVERQWQQRTRRSRATTQAGG